TPPAKGPARLPVANAAPNGASSPARLAAERSPLQRPLIHEISCRYPRPPHRARGPKGQTEPMTSSPRSSGPGVHDLHGRIFRSSLPPRTLIGFIAAAVAIFAIALVSYETLRRRAGSAERMAHALRVSQQIEVVLSSVKDAETGQRGFLITH